MLKNLLLFLAGLLVGANLVYFAMTRDRPATVQPAPVATGDAAGTTATTGAMPSAEPPVDATPPQPTGTPAAMPPASATPFPATPAAPTPAQSGQSAPAASGLLIPVRGITAAQLSDTFDDARGTERIHEALDIMAPRGTPVLAATDGKVAKLFTSDAGGLTIYQFDPGETHAYYYAHLERYAPGLEEGQQLRRGQVIGEVGSTGNANPDGPHLHFAIFKLGPEKNWWEGTPINPYPLLVGRQAPATPPVTSWSPQ